tara:strand:+ start:592 stop:843 length:252 start_codon:yes stop_codon:yes gene_type:complete
MNKLIYISSTWCQPCKTLAPIMDQVSSTGIPVQKIDADQNPEITSQYGVRSVPTVIKVNSSGGEIGRFSGIKQVQEIINFYNN